MQKREFLKNKSYILGVKNKTLDKRKLVVYNYYT